MRAPPRPDPRHAGPQPTPSVPDGLTLLWTRIGLQNQLPGASVVITTTMTFSGFKKPRTTQWPWRRTATIATALSLHPFLAQNHFSAAHTSKAGLQKGERDSISTH